MISLNKCYWKKRQNALRFEEKQIVVSVMRKKNTIFVLKN